ncbi:hypothetical protein QOT17_001241 [Balamuthia mandrillaris]
METGRRRFEEDLAKEEESSGRRATLGGVRSGSSGAGSRAGVARMSIAPVVARSMYGQRGQAAKDISAANGHRAAAPQKTRRAGGGGGGGGGGRDKGKGTVTVDARQVTEWVLEEMRWKPPFPGEELSLRLPTSAFTSPKLAPMWMYLITHVRSRAKIEHMRRNALLHKKQQDGNHIEWKRTAAKRDRLRAELAAAKSRLSQLQGEMAQQKQQIMSSEREKKELEERVSKAEKERMLLTVYEQKTAMTMLVFKEYASRLERINSKLQNSDSTTQETTYYPAQSLLSPTSETSAGLETAVEHAVREACHKLVRKQQSQQSGTEASLSSASEDSLANIPASDLLAAVMHITQSQSEALLHRLQTMIMANNNNDGRYYNNVTTLLKEEDEGEEHRADLRIRQHAQQISSLLIEQQRKHNQRFIETQRLLNEAHQLRQNISGSMLSSKLASEAGEVFKLQSKLEGEKKAAATITAFIQELFSLKEELLLSSQSLRKKLSLVQSQTNAQAKKEAQLRHQLKKNKLYIQRLQQQQAACSAFVRQNILNEHMHQELSRLIGLHHDTVSNDLINYPSITIGEQQTEKTKASAIDAALAALKFDAAYKGWDALLPHVFNLKLEMEDGEQSTLICREMLHFLKQQQQNEKEGKTLYKSSHTKAAVGAHI